MRVLAALLIALTPACAASGLNFREDDRVQIVSPRDREEVDLPVEVRWSATGLPGARFAVFVDAAPMGPGRDLRSIADLECQRTPGCPDANWMRLRNVFVTQDAAVRIETIPRPLGGASRDREPHELVVVLLGPDGRRLGESAFTREFFVRRGT